MLFVDICGPKKNMQQSKEFQNHLKINSGMHFSDPTSSKMGFSPALDTFWLDFGPRLASQLDLDLKIMTNGRSGTTKPKKSDTISKLEMRMWYSRKSSR